MTIDFYKQGNFDARLIIEGIGDLGLWNRNSQTWDSEATEIDDPEYGNVQLGGKQSGDSVELTRAWHRVRDGSKYRAVKAIRGRRAAQILVLSRDNDGNYDPVPVDTLKGVVKSIDLPEGERNGSDATMAKIVVQVNA